MKKTMLIALLCFAMISCEDAYLIQGNIGNSSDPTIVDVEPFNKDMIAYYPFNGNSLNEVDFENNGMVEGPVLTLDINTSEESAYLFNGIDDVIRVDYNQIFNLSEAFTVSALVQPREIKSQTIVRKGAIVNGPESTPYAITLSATGNIIFSVTTANGDTLNQASTAGYEVNQWYLITGVFKDNTLSLYVNGELVDTVTSTGAVTSNTEPLLIGTRLNLPSSTFNGIIDEVRIYEVALEASDIEGLYNSL